MASRSMNCDYSRPCQVKKIVFLIVSTFLCFVGQTLAIPDYKKLHENLSLKKDLASSNLKAPLKDGTPIIAEVGKVFKFPLDNYILKGYGKDKPTVKIFQHGKDTLPNWLSYSEEKNRLVGLPFLEDKGPIKIVLKTGLKGRKKKYKFEIDVRESTDKFHCHLGNPAFVAAAILSVNLKDFSGLTRLKLVEKFSEFIEVAYNDFIIEEKGRKNAPDETIETSGPGDYIKTKSPDVIIKWKVDCRRGLAGDISVNTLRASSGNQRIFNSVGVPFRGWYVYKHQARVRRQIFPLATPGATPTATVQVPGVATTVISGTPVISATPTIIIKTTTIVTATASSSTPVVVKPTVIVTKKPPTTTPKTTTEKPTTTEEPTTTKRPTTTKPPTTTKRPTTTEEPATESTTREKTTKEVESTTTTTKMFIRTTTMEPKTTRKPESTSKPSTKLLVPTTGDRPPILKNPIDLINAKVGQPIKLKIEKDVFEDDYNVDTYGLALSLKRKTDQKLVNVDESLIYLDIKNYFIYMLPMLGNVGDTSFALQATDKAGNQKNAVFIVKVEDENIEYNDVFNVTIDTDFDMVMKSAFMKVNMAEKVAKATEVDYKSMRIQRFYRGSVIMSYSSADLPSDSCNSAKTQAYTAKLEGSKFKDDMAPDYVVVKTSHANVGSNCGGNGGEKHPTQHARAGAYKWWEVVLIPVIVIAVLLLIIGLIFFFLYRRKRRYEPQKEDKNTFLYQKKPVIFTEEYEEKPDVLSLEPLVLPNEREPLTNAAYHPRSSTPDGNGSSSGSTEPDEKRLINENSSPQTPPSRSPTGRSPPPYSGQ